MATTETFVPGRLYKMPLAKLQHDPTQSRKYIDPAALDELTASIREHGVIEPVLSLTRLPQAVRDECRKDPSVPKRVLIEITARKQERSMLRTYEAYKAKVNPLKREKTGEAAVTVQVVAKALHATRRKIEALGPPKPLMEEKEELAMAMNGLKGMLEIALAETTEPEAPEMDEPPEERDIKAY